MSDQAITRIQKALYQELNLLNDLIRQSTRSQVALINQIAEYIIFSGGKRIRPMVLLLMFKALNENKNHHKEYSVLMAAVVEFIHTSTLLHDDVVDESETRRNQKSSNTVWGNAASVLVGDFLYSRSFQMMLKINNPRVLEVLATTTNSIAEGEVLQLLETQNKDLSEKKYFEIIERKTAILFASSCEIAAIISACDEKEITLAKEYGMHLGVLFQIIDDSLDYFGSTKKMGKKIGDDWAERKVTLPLILAMKSENKDWFTEKFDPQILKKAGVKPRENLLAVITEMKKLGIDKKISEIAKHHGNQAIQAIKKMKSQNQYSENLIDLAHWLTERSL